MTRVAPRDRPLAHLSPASSPHAHRRLHPRRPRRAVAVRFLPRGSVPCPRRRADRRPRRVASIQAAINTAQEGDLILVSDSIFNVGQTTISGKTVSVFLEVEPRTYVSSTSFGLRVFGLTAGQDVVWRGIGFDQDSGSIVQEPLAFGQCEGTIWMERSANKSVRGTLDIDACDEVVLAEVKCLSPGFQEGNGPAPAAVEVLLSELFILGGEYLGGRGRNAKFGQDGFPNKSSTDGGDGIALTTSSSPRSARRSRGARAATRRCPVESAYPPRTVLMRSS